MKYKIVEDKSGPSIGKVATVFLSYSESIGNKPLTAVGIYDKRIVKLYATYPQFQGDLHDALQYLSEGDSAIVMVSLDSVKKINHAPIIANDTAKYLTYSIRINKVINQNCKSDDTYFSRIKEYDEQVKLDREKTEQNKIKSYLSDQKHKYKATSSGLLLPEEMKTVNNAGDEIYVSYMLTSLDGQVFSSKYEKMKPEDAKLTGLKEAFSLTPKGQKTKIIMPSKLAFGAIGDHYKMAPFTPLICEFIILNK